MTGEKRKYMRVTIVGGAWWQYESVLKMTAGLRGGKVEYGRGKCVVAEDTKRWLMEMVWEGMIMRGGRWMEITVKYSNSTINRRVMGVRDEM